MTRPIFSATNDGQFGSFHYPHGLIEFTLSEPAQQIVERIGRGDRVAAGEMDQDLAVHLAYEITSLFHEMRHFVDVFGTLAGITLFSNYIAQLKAFADISSAMRGAGMHWQVPLSEWTQQDDCPQAVRDFIRTAKGFDVASDIFVAPFNPVEIEGHRNDLIIELDFEGGGKVDAFPLRVGRISESKELLRTVLYPIGLEALLEGNAHALCRNFVESYFPSYVAEQLEHRILSIPSRDINGQEGQRAAQTATPYMIIDLLITRFLKRHSIDSFPRNLVLAVTDRILSTSSMQKLDAPHGSTAISIDRIGGNLCDLLESEDPGGLAAGRLSDAPHVSAGYEALLAGLERGNDWDSILDDYSPRTSIEIWEAYVAQNFIVPLLRERLATEHRAFTNSAEFLPLISKIGIAPARVVNGKMVLGDMPKRVQQAWHHQLMLGKILSQLVRGGRILCPRAHATVPGIDSFNLAIEYECSTHMRLGCGSYVPRQIATEPNCLFESALKVSALKR